MSTRISQKLSARRVLPSDDELKKEFAYLNRPGLKKIIRWRLTGF